MTEFRRLHERRAAAFRQEVMPFMRYVLGGGLLLAAGFIGAALVGYYASLIQDYPAEFPMTLVGTAALLPLLAWGHVRTYIQPADVVYLTPAEHRMPEYLRPAYRKHLTGQAAALLLAFSVLWPLYRLESVSRGAEAAPGWAEYAAMALMLVGVKAALHGEYWRSEQQFDRIVRTLRGLLRWVLAAAFLLVFWREAVLLQLAAAGAALLIVLLVSRMGSGTPLLWEQLIRRERQARAAWFRFLGWFVDHLPEQPKLVRARSLWNRLFAVFFRYGRGGAYRLLYGKAFLRTELWGVWLRLALLGALFIALFDAAWLKAAASLVAFWMTAMQLSQLERMFRGYSWLHVYPLSESDRLRAVGSVAFAAQAAAVVVWAAAWALSGRPVQGASALFAGLAAAWFAHRRHYPKKWSSRDD